METRQYGLPTPLWTHSSVVSEHPACEKKANLADFEQTCHVTDIV